MRDQVAQLVGRHANVQDELLVIPKGTLDLLDFTWLQLDTQRLVQVVLELSDVEVLAHVDVPVWLRHETRNQPVCIVKVLFVGNVLSFWLRLRAQEVRREEVRLQLFVGKIITRLQFSLRENIWLHHVDEDLACRSRALHLLHRSALSGRSRLTRHQQVRRVVGNVRLVEYYWSRESVRFGTLHTRHSFAVRLDVVSNVGHGHHGRLTDGVVGVLRDLLRFLDSSIFTLFLGATARSCNRTASAGT